MRKLLIPIAALFLVTGCYEDYVRDFDYAAVYAAYQYDLRTFVLGEGAQFDFSVALGGVMANDRDRAVEITLDESLLTGAVAGMKSQSLVSGDYVSSAFKSFSGSDLTPLPASHYSVSGIEGLTIRKGRHTASVTLRATDAMAADPLAFKPGYAVAFKTAGKSRVAYIFITDFDYLVVIVVIARMQVKIECCAVKIDIDVRQTDLIKHETVNRIVSQIENAVFPFTRHIAGIRIIGILRETGIHPFF